MKKYLVLVFLCMQIFCFAIENSENKKFKILLGSPVYRKPDILKEFLESLKRLEKDSFTLDYFFVDDNNVDESQQQLKDFNNDIKSNCLILQSQNDIKFVCDNVTHHWNEKLVEKVATFKDHMIQKALNDNYDYLFLIDSDIVLHPKTIERLIETKKDIISNIFWTQDRNGVSYFPQVWVSDEYTLYKKEPSEKISEQEKVKRRNDFFNMLLKPGTYEVGGLGACTLISKRALQKGVSFLNISNLTMFGEDRHFCIRAVALGLSLFVDTHYPAYHIYRDSDLAGVEQFKKKCGISSISNYDKSEITSRFFLKSDQQMNSVSEIPLPTDWWSRPFEYKWASKFIGAHYKVLDAACGICHPFKWFLNETCGQAWACDINPQILDYEKILQETNLLFENKDKEKINLDLQKMIKTRLVCSSICNLPDYMPIFDRIFCISTLDKMTQEDAKKALSEFAKKLAPNGLLILTVDYPKINPVALLEMAESEGLIPAGDVELGSPPEDALNGAPVYPALCVFRLILKHK